MLRLVQYAHDVGLLHDQEILAVDLDLGARPLAEQHAVANLDVDRNELAGLVTAARAHRGHFALRRLFLRGVGDDDATSRLLIGGDTLDDDAVVKRTKLHGILHVLIEPKRFANSNFSTKGACKLSPEAPSIPRDMRPKTSIKRLSKIS